MLSWWPLRYVRERQSEAQLDTRFSLSWIEARIKMPQVCILSSATSLIRMNSTKMSDCDIHDPQRKVSSSHPVPIGSFEKKMQ